MTGDEKQVLVDMIEAMNKQLDQRDRISKAQAIRAQNVARARRQKDRVESKRNKRQMILVGIAAAVLGIIMLQFIFSIWKDMDVMRQQMEIMGSQMVMMAEDIGAMRPAMVEMNGNMKGMAVNFDSVATNMNSMSVDFDSVATNMAQMNQSVKNMNTNTAIMRTGVSHMAHDMNTMSQPFNVMDTFIPPWW
jgi:uncharacterized protein YoxC